MIRKHAPVAFTASLQSTAKSASNPKYSSKASPSKAITKLVLAGITTPASKLKDHSWRGATAEYTSSLRKARHSLGSDTNRDARILPNFLPQRTTPSESMRVIENEPSVTASHSVLVISTKRGHMPLLAVNGGSASTHRSRLSND